ncbi:MAG: hypothetical protein HOF95_02890 [Rhodospirillales bacterium]|jgi:DNA-binding PadR family transcriptional regulator|nr:hypothetical protein [Rhodospirillales bacterium]MBT4005723.1 hypothetical protein [Rhodospirillales bacterium]MBT5077162.1 hypothetical protein [Rhodospirillales bacterium]MBT5113378.1 hypothetical protein [Rhodospirillales bacterium]MBT5672204.1 hypothetical protein [Rhodospirillales bacterium]
MYPDHSLMPKEAIRLAALGMVGEGPVAYADLASRVRDFTSHIMGPNIDLMGTSIQILCLEGLVTSKGTLEGQPLSPDAELTITESGERELKTLLMATVRTPFDDLNKLIIALKMRFFDHLDDDAKRSQIDLITFALEGEMARLAVLYAQQSTDAPSGNALAAWLDHELNRIEADLQWFKDFKTRL